MLCIGICTGLVAVIIDTIVEYTTEVKYSYIAKCKQTNDFDFFLLYIKIN